MTPEAVLIPQAELKCTWVDQEYPPVGEFVPYRVTLEIAGKPSLNVVFYEPRVVRLDQGWTKDFYFRVEPEEQCLMIGPSSSGTNGEKLSVREIIDTARTVFGDGESRFWLEARSIYLTEDFQLSLHFGKPYEGAGSFVRLHEFSGRKVTAVEGERKKSISWKGKEFVLFPFCESKGWGVLVAPQTEWKEKVDSLQGLFRDQRRETKEG